MQKYILPRLTLDFVRKDSLIFYLSDGKCFSNKKNRYIDTANLNYFCMYNIISLLQVFFFIIKLLFKFHIYKSQIFCLSTLYFMLNYKNFKKSTLNLTYKLNFLT